MYCNLSTVFRFFAHYHSNQSVKPKWRSGVFLSKTDTGDQEQRRQSIAQTYYSPNRYG